MFELNTVYNFYGVDCNHIKLDDKIYEALEDQDDGYRSHLDTIEICDEHDSSISNLIFFNNSIATVSAEYLEIKDEFRGYILKDIDDGHIWLKVGTNLTDDYYPCFVFEYNINENKKVQITDEHRKEAIDFLLEDY